MSSGKAGRVVYVNDIDQTISSAKLKQKAYCDNVVVTSKYTAISFLPKSLFEQFRRIANAYFLMVSLLQLLTDLSPTNEYSTIGPLVLVLMATMVKEGIEDKARHDADRQVNGSSCRIMDPSTGVFKDKQWSDIRVAHIIKVMNGESLPADLVVLDSSEVDGIVQVETSNLDGESNLKTRRAVSMAKEEMNNTVPFSGQSGTIECENPNTQLYQFNGILHMKDQDIPISLSNALWRGMTVKNTKWIVGVVVYAGKDTKMMQNAKPIPSKFSRMDLIVNKGIMLIFALLFVLCTISTILGCLWQHRASTKSGYIRYLPFVQDFSLVDIPKIWITFLILYNNFVPISLYICLELVKWYQAKKMEQDPLMECPETKMPAIVRTSNLNEDVGQVQYIFSDKTGTLTRNEMRFRGCSIGGFVYTRQQDDAMSETVYSRKQRSKDIIELSHDVLIDQLQHSEDESKHEMLVDFFRCMSVCHEATMDGGSMQSSSPDELALLEASNEFGFTFVQRKINTIEINELKMMQTYEILALNEFNSVRKVMSIVVRQPDGQIVVYSKGADSVMLSNRRHTKGDKIVQDVNKHLHHFASSGLRTLVFGKRVLTQDQFDDWFRQFTQARTSLEDREEKMNSVAKIIETGHEILGATGVEDRLQEGVPECIQTLVKGGIILWVLTGDKDETAISVAYSCGLLNAHTRLVLINGKTRQDCLDQISQCRRRLKKELAWHPGVISGTLSLVINGSALEFLLGEAEKGDHVSTQSATNVLMKVALQCSSVVACRLCPLQKAQVVALMKNSKGKPMTLAIGDGGNDVSMIQEAHIGIGISGHEGTQAMRSADFALGQFRFLSQLILVHGRWNYRRIALVILFSFYKNMALIMVLFWFTFSNAYSGQTLYESYLMVGWNVCYTLMPVFVLGIADEDLTADIVRKYPEVFRMNHTGFEFNIGKISIWCGNALLHSVLAYLFTAQFFRAIPSQFGHDAGLFPFGTTVYGVLVIIVCLKSALTMQRLHRWTRLHHFSVYIGSILYFLFIMCYSQMYEIMPNLHLLRDFYGIGEYLLSQALFWLALPVLSCACLLVDLTLQYLVSMYNPSVIDIMKEIDSGLSNDKTAPEPVIRHQRRLSFRDRRLLGGSLLHQGIKEDDPTDEEELSRKLMTLQREAARSHGRTDPFLRNEERETAHAVAAEPATHPLTMEFVGKSNELLETEYNSVFVTREARRVQLCMKILSILIPPYALFEVIVEGDGQNLWIRIVMGVAALLYLRYSYTKTFLRHYQQSVVLPLGLTGIGLTMSITFTGKFAITALPIVLFSVLRVRFIDAILLATVNYLFYLVAGEIGLKFSMIRSPAPADTLMFSMFMAFIISFAAYSSYSLQMAMRRDFLQYRSLKMEEDRSTEILSNMLPRHVTQRLQNGDTLISETEPNVTVIFCDIVSFSSMIERYTPRELVTLLDRIYSLFDELCVNHGVQKMETVGKTYMACAGLQGHCQDPAIKAVELAMDMLSTISKCESSEGNRIKIRVGIHSGRVISGLVGMKKQQFSLFGDTVNTASRMQSTGVSGMCQISDVTYRQLNNTYKCEQREIQVKGKGLMTTYLVLERIPSFRDSIVHVDERITSLLDLKHASTYRLQRVRKEWRRYDPCRLLFGQNENPAIEEAEMEHEIDPITLYFRDPAMEKMYLSLTMPSRMQGSERTMSVLALYMIFVAVRDTVIYYTDTYSSLTSNIDATEYFTIALGFRLPVALMIGLFTLWVHKNASSVKYIHHRNLQAIVFYVTSLCALISQFWLTKFDANKSDRFTDMCLDTVMILFLASNGGSMLHKVSIVLNNTIFAVLAIFALLLYRSENDKSQFKMYPIVLTFFTTIANMIAVRGVEFFTRRKIWLKHKTQRETNKAQELLYKMLPAQVIKQLKNGETVCNQHRKVGLLFSDVKGFTSISSRAKTDQVVELLASLFTAFDKLTEKHGVFKMQTIGDAYVIVSGLPFADTQVKQDVQLDMEAEVCSDTKVSSRNRGKIAPMRRTSSTSLNSERSDACDGPYDFTHLPRLIAMANDMHKEVQKVIDPTTGENLQMRIGIHLGSVIGGVIGTTTLRYDMWGPDVLTANELESNGVPEQTLTSEDVKDALCQDTSLNFKFYDRIQLTSREMDTYLVELNEEEDN